MRKAILHIIFWIAFFLVWQRVIYFYIDNSLNRFLFSAFDIGLIIIVFYIIFYFITPVFFNRKNKLSFIAGFCICIFAASFLVIWVMNVFLKKNIVPIRFNFHWEYTDLVNNKYFIALSGAIAGLVMRLSLNWLSAKRKIEMTERANISSELLYLKAQLNPHFLFNAINTIYIQMDLSKEEAKHTLSTFSEMLRYQLYECDVEKIAIEKEVQYIRNYMRLQRLRLDENYMVNFSYSDSLNNFTIAPLLLLPFIENACKHFSAEDDESFFIKGELKKEGELFIFHCSNSKDKKNVLNNHTGIGLSNVKRRLELLYPNKHSLTITDSDTKFEIWLTIQINT
jgi:two-component system LytT family sensor kinase